jgi:membrane protein YdbS with pleckstrin-like domain
MDDRVSDEVARNRWLVINVVRLAGVAMVIVGLLITQQVIPEPAWSGYLLLAVGLLDIFLVPLVLARKWRSPRE